MSSISNIAISTTMPQDLALKIGISGINEILLVFWAGLNCLKKDSDVYINPTTEEDDITLAWYQKIQLIWDSRNRATTICLNNLQPIHQYPDNTMKKKKGKKAPTIDFCFKDWQTSNSYFGAECKNLYKNDKTKIKRYVETGVENFTSGRYGSESSENSIIGYILSGDIPTIVQALITEISTTAPISNLLREMKYTEPQYKSIHLQKLDNKDIVLHHLFFDFVN